jgi:uncharacterized protein involved in outer membrane biogenesis
MAGHEERRSMMPPRRATARRWVLGGLVAAVLVVAAAALAWHHLPGWLQARVEQEASQALGRRVTLERLELSASPLTLTLHGLRVAAAGEPVPRGQPEVPPQLRVQRVHVALAMASLAARAPVLDEVQLEGVRARLARVAPGGTDVDDILERLRASAQAGPASAPRADNGPPRLALRRLRVVDSQLQLDDRVVGQSMVLSRIGLELDDFSTLEDAPASRLRPRLAFTLDDVPVTLAADATPFAPTPQASFELGLAAALPLARAWAYLPAGLPGRPEGGALSTTLSGRVALPAGQPLQLELRGDAVLDALAWRLPGSAQPLSWRRLVVEGLHLTLHERRLALARVRLEGPQAEAGRDRRGRLWLGGPAQAAVGGKGSPASAGRVAAAAAAPARGPAAAADAATSGASAPAWQVSVARVEVADGQLGWADAATPAPVRWRVQAFQAAAQPLAWPPAGPVGLEMSAQLHTPGLPPSAWQARGRWTQAALEATLKAEGLRVEALAPYLTGVLRPLASGRLRLEAQVVARTEPSLGVQLQLRQLQGESLQLREPGAPVPSVRVARLTVEDARLQWPAARVQVGRVRVQAPTLAVVRTADGSLDVERWVVASGAVSPATHEPPPGAVRPAVGAQGEPRRQRASPAPPAWALRLDDVTVDGARLQWRDETPEVRQDGRPLELGFGVPSLRVQGLAWPPGRAPARVGLRAQLEPAADGDVPGQIEAQLSLGLSPPSVRGTVRAERVPLHRVAPYVAAELPVRVASAELGVQAELDLTRTDAGLAGRLEGRALLADVLLRSRVAGADVQVGDELLSWQSLAVEPVRARWQPGERPAVEIGQVVLSDAYSRLVVTERGTFNLVDTVRPDSARGAPAAPSSPPSAAPEPAPTPAATPASARWPVALTVGETRLVRGRVDFSDRFVQPNYSAALTELEGMLGRFSSEDRELPSLQITGRAAGTAELQVRGSLNPLVVPPVLDLSARATGFELSTISTYAAKYAGYAIERGKLSLDLAYRVDADGQLQARNQLVINQLTFGEKVDSPDATTLPVRLAIALLTDRHGVIDLDLPISGSINDPQFSVFGLVLKVLGNLIVKAVTAPFAWLAGGGDRADLSVVEFRPGTAELAASSAAVLDRVAQALSDRPALRMTVTGVADPASEREAMQAEALAQRLRAEQRRELARAGRALATDAPLPELVPSQRDQLLARVYEQTALPDKPRNVLGFIRKLPPAEMEGLLRRAVVVSTDSARELAIRRGLAVREALVARGLSAERLFLGAPRLRVSGEDDAAWTPRVQLAISGP